MTYPGPSTSYDTAGMRLTIPGGHGDRSGHSRVPISPTEVESMNNAFGAGMQFDENHPPCSESTTSPTIRARWHSESHTTHIRRIWKSGLPH
ncbi:Protein of unknown function [Pyronema omphalodes CBS 100304]|uniref:Uncharacterized protein n=1 Tax=Pyronema omphalodes (strain CBS 100304) TaxID=1076935 RepID=U4LLH2_PYROM|nr:Protein of unknown function [Pyronema omphalodes CBS 100304]